jgi:hypothetical protein
MHSDAALEEKLRASIVQVVSPAGYATDSGSQSDDEDEDGGGFFIDLSSRRKRRDNASSSGADKFDDSATSANLRSRSPSPADDDSPDPGPSARLWPVMSATEPNTLFAARTRRRSSPPQMVSPPIPTSAPNVGEEASEKRRWDLSGTRAMLIRKKGKR